MIPVPIANGTLNQALPQQVLEVTRELSVFLVENAKSARAFLKEIKHPRPIAELTIIEIGHHTDPEKIIQYVEPLLQGNDVGIISEAGCPGIADPGAQIVAEAQARGISVVPLVGPCSIILALMASGLDGQHFRFCGYLPIKEPQRSKTIRALEKQSLQGVGETQLFIETPYRNTGLLRDLVKYCAPNTRILVAVDITGSAQSIRTMKASEWKKIQDLPKLPTIFGLLATR